MYFYYLQDVLNKCYSAIKKELIYQVFGTLWHSSTLGYWALRLSKLMPYFFDSLVTYCNRQYYVFLLLILKWHNEAPKVLELTDNGRYSSYLGTCTLPWNKKFKSEITTHVKEIRGGVCDVVVIEKELLCQADEPHASEESDESEQEIYQEILSDSDSSGSEPDLESDENRPLITTNTRSDERATNFLLWLQVSESSRLTRRCFQILT